MKMRIIILVAAVTLSFAVSAGAAVETEKLLKSIGTLNTYKYGKTNGVDLTWVDKQVAMSSKEAGARGKV